MSKYYERKTVTKRELWELYQEDIAVLRDLKKRTQSKNKKRMLNKIIYILIVNCHRLGGSPTSQHWEDL